MILSCRHSVHFFLKLPNWAKSNNTESCFSSVYHWYYTLGIKEYGKAYKHSFKHLDSDWANILEKLKKSFFLICWSTKYKECFHVKISKGEKPVNDIHTVVLKTAMQGWKHQGMKKGGKFSGDKVSRTLQYEGVKNLASISWHNQVLNELQIKGGRKGRKTKRKLSSRFFPM